MLELFYNKNSSNKSFFIDPDNENINEMIEYVKKKTGLYIDPYSDTKLYPSHQELIISFLNNYSDTHIDLINFFKGAIELDTIVYCIGD